MKTERRHELQTNVLANWLGHQVDVVRPYGKLIAGAAAVLVVGILVATYMMNDRAARASVGWSDFFAAAFEANPDRLRSVAEDHRGTVAGLWAQLAEADLELGAGIRALYQNRADAREALERAESSYEQVAAAAGSAEELRVCALFGLAQVHEARSELERATDYYRQVVQLAPDSARAKEAERRLASLSDPELIRFYNWFANQEPQPTPFPGSLPSGLDFSSGFPLDLSELSDTPDDAFLPSGGQDTNPAAGQPTGTELPAGPALNPPAAAPEDPAPGPAEPEPAPDEGSP